MNQDKQPEALRKLIYEAVLHGISSGTSHRITPKKMEFRPHGEDGRNALACLTDAVADSVFEKVGAELAALKAAPTPQSAGPVREQFERAYAIEWASSRGGNETPEQLAQEVKGWRDGESYPADMPYLKHTWDGFQWAVSLRATPSAPAAVASEYAHRELYFAAYALCDGVCEDHPEIDNVFSIGTHGRLCNALAGLDAHYDVSSPDERISKDQLPPAAPQAQDVQRDAIRSLIAKHSAELEAGLAAAQQEIARLWAALEHANMRLSELNTILQDYGIEL